jgi:hypothetical protein
MFRPSSRIVVSVVTAMALGGLWAASTASADVSSVDAYAGQAQVFGKPHHRHHLTPGGASATRANSRGGSGAGAVRARGSGGPPASGLGAPSPSSAHPSSAGPSSAGPSSARASHSSRSTRPRRRSAAHPAQPLDAQPARASSGVGGLTSFDILAIVLGAVVLVATAIAVRRFTRPAA